MLQLLVYLLVVGLVIGIVWWVVDYIPVPHPLNRWIKIITIIIGAIILINVLLSLSGSPLFPMR